MATTERLANFNHSPLSLAGLELHKSDVADAMEMRVAIKAMLAREKAAMGVQK